ncbi:hypothetical protein K458DRAFT_188012 [Lentithecium fluviatile CBS 122367]|uniref:HRQ family protein 2 n=1 Tax=Lentithecium fluviatile CBS 122367 TaxID=1168545 RepID=A0A6G1JAS2_9PLEO|nr:hypothetical protein K458DRAFT_188012 [Lentithecium fluviatile CBS 122367]
MMDLIKSPQSWALVLAVMIIYVCRRCYRRRTAKNSPPFPTPASKQQPVFSEDAYYQIEPLSSFDLANEEPIKIRPFKPTYHLTMAIENITINELVTMDKTYPDRIALRKTLYAEKGDDVLAINEIAAPAVIELYTYLTTTYLPTRFPTIYSPTPTGLLNNITRETLSLHPTSGASALQTLGEWIDLDLLLLLPIQVPGPDQGKYRLEAFNTCFPSGFNTRSKLGLKLADIHTPVPSYAAKLGKSMDRFFASVPVGKLVKRHNWSITTNSVLFNLSGNHMSEDEVTAKAESWDDVDLTQTVLRCERQTLHRLPKTGAILFAFKTYQYPIRDLRDEGSGEELAAAIDGLGMGNAPGMMVYKRQVVWGEKVKAFLRGEIGLDGCAIGSEER